MQQQQYTSIELYTTILYNIRAPRSKFVGTTARKERTKIFVSSARFFVSVASGKGNHYDEPSDKILGCENRLLYRSHKILCYSSQAIFNMPDIYYITENAASNCCCCCCCWYCNGTLVPCYSKKQQNPRVILLLVEVRNIPCASGRNTG